MAVLECTVKGRFKKINRRFEKLKNIFRIGILDEYGKKGVDALTAATPVDSGITSTSWEYKIERNGDLVSIVFSNDSSNDNYGILFGLINGHLTKSGTWVEGHDFVTEALEPIIDELTNKIREEMDDK